MRKAKQFGILAVAVLWLILCGACWFWPRTEISGAERRKLAQFPTTLTKRFPGDFEAASLDQFPLRDGFRTLKALTHYGLLRQSDNNGIYLAKGYAAKLEYPLDTNSVNHVSRLLEQLYEKHFAASGGRIFLSVVPDKTFFLADQTGCPAMDYEELVQKLTGALPFAEYVDITGALDLSDYYRTDTHWKQEQLFGVAGRLCEAMGVTAPEPELFETVQAKEDFYGVYFGQAALPMMPDTLCTLKNPVLEGCTVFNLETGRTTGLYDWEKLDSRDPYEVYLSGAAALLTIDNPMGDPDRELVVFRDSFGSSLIPLLLRDYGKVTAVDLRYLRSQELGNYVDFHGQDVLLLYSTLVLNSSSALK